MGKDNPIESLNYHGLNEIQNSNDSLLLNKLLEQAEEIGRLREQIQQMKQRFEKDAAYASTGTIADVG